MKLQRDSWKVGRLLAVSFGIASLFGLLFGAFLLVAISRIDQFIFAFFLAAIPTLVLLIPFYLLIGVVANHFGSVNLKTMAVVGILLSMPLIAILSLYSYLEGFSENKQIGWLAWLGPLAFGSTPIAGLLIFYKFYLQHVYQPIKDASSK